MTMLLGLLGRWRRPLMLMVVGGAATLAYSSLAMLGTVITPWPTGVVSFLAYAIAGVLSYQGHRVLTFSITGGHGAAPVRFVALGALGSCVAFAVPALVTDGLGFPSIVSIALTCVVAPVLNAIALSRFVFRAPLLDAPPVGVAPLRSETQA